MHDELSKNSMHVSGKYVQMITLSKNTRGLCGLVWSDLFFWLLVWFGSVFDCSGLVRLRLVWSGMVWYGPLWGCIPRAWLSTKPGVGYISRKPLL